MQVHVLGHAPVLFVFQFYLKKKNPHWHEFPLYVCTVFYSSLCGSKGVSTVQSQLLWESIINWSLTRCLCWPDGSWKVSRAFWLNAWGEPHETDLCCKRKRHPAKTICLQGSCCFVFRGAALTINTLPAIWQRTMAEGAPLPPGLRVNIPALFRSLWIPKMRCGRGEEKGREAGLFFWLW